MTLNPEQNPFRQLAISLTRKTGTSINKLETISKVERDTEAFKNGKLSLFENIKPIINKHKKPVLMIVDQLEELFTLSNVKEDAALQKSFLAQLTKSVEYIEKDSEFKGLFKLLIVIRSDFISHALNQVEFGKAISGIWNCTYSNEPRRLA